MPRAGSMRQDVNGETWMVSWWKSTASWEQPARTQRSGSDSTIARPAEMEGTIERERRERETERQTEEQTEREGETGEGERERQTETDRDRQRETDRERERESERE